jgi:transposase
MSSSKHPPQHQYPPELRERAVRMVQEAIAESGERFGAVTRVARQLGVGTEALRNWAKQAEIDGGQRPGVSSKERRRIVELERRTASFGEPMRSSRARRLSSRPSRTADGRDDPLHRRPQGPVRGRADLRGVGDRPLHLLRRRQPATLCTATEDEALKPERPIAGEMTFTFGRLKRSELPAVLSGCSQAQALQRSIVVFREQGDRDVSGFVMTA